MRLRDGLIRWVGNHGGSGDQVSGEYIMGGGY